MDVARANDGTNLRWQREGVGPPLLLIAGQASSFHGWDSVVGRLAETHTVIRFEHRGVGDSGLGEADRYSTRAFAEDAATVLDAAGVPSAAVYGHSMGGRVAQWMAIDTPDRVDRLVLACTTGGDARGVTRDAATTAVLTSGDRAALLPLFFSDSFAAEHPDAVHSFFAGRTSRQSRGRHFRASRDHDAWDELASIRIPTLVVHGGDDRLTPVRNAEFLAEAIPGSRLHVEPEGLHALHLESPTAQAAIASFLAS